MKTSLPHRFLLASAAVGASLGATVPAQATLYDIVSLGSDNALVEFSDPANWTVDGAPAATYPQSGDEIRFGTSSTQYHAYLALDGDYTIKDFKQQFNCPHFYKSANAVANTVTFTITSAIGTGQYHYFFVNDGVRLVFPAGSTYNTAYWDGGSSQMNVNAGGTTEIRGAVTSRHARYKIANGGTLIFAPTSYSASNFSGQYDSFTVASGGTLTFPNGLNVTGGNNSTLLINQNGGIVTFGGSFTSIAPWTYTWNDGTLAITDDATFAANIALVIPASKSVTLDIASGKTFAAPGLSADSTSSITVTGGGMFSIAPTTAPIILQNGSLGLATAGTYDLSNVSVGAGAATITLTALGARVDSLPAALATATFVADLSSAQAGTVVFQSADPSVLAKVKSDLAASVPQGFDLVASGQTLSLEEISDYIFNSTSVTDLLNASGWNTGSVPPANASVSIDGAGVVAEYTSGAIPAWASIEIKNGATLRMSTDADLPAVVLNKNATLDIASGTSYLTNGLSCTAVALGGNVTLPVLSIQTNATLSVASGMKFKNVDFRLYGTVTKASNSDDSPVFGYAESGETSYFAFTADGGVFNFHSNQSEPKGSVYIVCPAAGGTVVPVGTITLRNFSRTVTGWGDFGNWEFGSNNPTSVPFDVLVDGTHIDVSAFFYAAGAAHLSLVNGSRIQRAASCAGHWFGQAIRDAATITLDEGCFYDFTTGDGSLGIDSQSVVDTVTVRNGGIYNATYNSSGWVRGVFVGDGGILGVSKLRLNSSVPRARTDLLRGFGSARIDGGLTIASINGIGLGDGNWDRHVQMANLPFAGTGDVVISNGVPAYPFSVTIRNGASTATGSIGVAAVQDADTALYFANGANWAGTVKANGDVKLVTSFAEVTNSAAVPAPVAVSFGGVQLLDDTFKLRLWQNGTCDTIALGANGWTGSGKLDFEFVDFAEARSQMWKIATQPANTALPAVKKASFSLLARPSETEGLEDVFLKVANGIAILLR